MEMSHSQKQASSLRILISLAWEERRKLTAAALCMGVSALATAGYARKLSRDFTFLGQSAVSWQTDGGAAYERTRLGMAYRSTENNRWNALGAYQHRWERQPDADGGAGSRTAHIVSGHANVLLTDGLSVRGQVAAKVAGLPEPFLQELGADGEVNIGG